MFIEALVELVDAAHDPLMEVHGRHRGRAVVVAIKHVRRERPLRGIAKDDDHLHLGHDGADDVDRRELKSYFHGSCLCIVIHPHISPHRGWGTVALNMSKNEKNNVTIDASVDALIITTKIHQIIIFSYTFVLFELIL